MKEANHTKYCKRTSQEERATRAKVLVHKRGWCVQRKGGQCDWNTESRAMAKVKLKRRAALDPMGPCNLEKSGL